MEAKNSYTATQRVYDALSENLKKEQDRLAQLLKYEKDVANHIEDCSRVILAVQRSLATLRSGIPEGVVSPPEAVPNSLREMMDNVNREERREQYQFSDEEMELAFERSLAVINEQEEGPR